MNKGTYFLEELTKHNNDTENCKTEYKNKLSSLYNNATGSDFTKQETRSYSLMENKIQSIGLNISSIRDSHYKELRELGIKFSKNVKRVKNEAMNYYKNNSPEFTDNFYTVYKLSDANIANDYQKYMRTFGYTTILEKEDDFYVVKVNGEEKEVNFLNTIMPEN